jgi:hypothetical protein
LPVLVVYFYKYGVGGGGEVERFAAVLPLEVS